MRLSQYFIATQKETPSDADTISHQFMIRAGLIRKLASGLYTWLPLGLRVLKKVENIVREEMNRSGALEILMPAIQPAELWQESGRWEQYGPELLRLKDRHERSFCFGPTHEEVITDLARREIKSYRELPLNLYQIQTKFRDEIRPRFGIMRAREFMMKDAYSFHLTEASLHETYEKMGQTYSSIFSRLGLQFKRVLADTGSIGGESSHEFHVLADTGEDEIVFSDTGEYAANVELARVLTPKIAAGDPSPDGLGKLVIKRGIEVGHIFKLGKKYSEAMHALVQNEAGESVPLLMGCYGMGISRIVAAAIEQGHDKAGILWPQSIAPFQIILIPVAQTGSVVPEKAAALYKMLISAGFEVLLDDRNERPGVKFSECDLTGVPHRVVLSEKTLAEGKVEYKNRRTGEVQLMEFEKVHAFLKKVASVACT